MNSSKYKSFTYYTFAIIFFDCEKKYGNLNVAKPFFFFSFFLHLKKSQGNDKNSSFYNILTNISKISSLTEDYEIIYPFSKFSEKKTNSQNCT